MPKTNFAPWSAETAQGIKTDPVDSNIRVKQEVIPAISVGTVNSLTGEWNGVIASDVDFNQDVVHAGVANAAAVLSPQRQPDYINMDGYKTLQFALMSNRAGTYGVLAVFGPDTNLYANLTPVAAGEGIRIINDSSISDENLLNDNVNLDAANQWFIFTILADRAIGQSMMQIKITNSAGGPADIYFAYRRLV